MNTSNFSSAILFQSIDCQYFEKEFLFLELQRIESEAFEPKNLVTHNWAFLGGMGLNIYLSKFMKVKRFARLSQAGLEPATQKRRNFKFRVFTNFTTATIYVFNCITKLNIRILYLTENNGSVEDEKFSSSTLSDETLGSKAFESSL